MLVVDDEVRRVMPRAFYVTYAILHCGTISILEANFNFKSLFIDEGDKLISRTVWLLMKIYPFCQTSELKIFFAR